MVTVVVEWEVRLVSVGMSCFQCDFRIERDFQDLSIVRVWTLPRLRSKDCATTDFVV